MRVKMINEIVDSEATPVALVFRDDEERLHIANLLLNMPSKSGTRAFIIGPQNVLYEKFCQDVGELCSL